MLYHFCVPRMCMSNVRLNYAKKATATCFFKIQKKKKAVLHTLFTNSYRHDPLICVKYEMVECNPAQLPLLKPDGWPRALTAIHVPDDTMKLFLKNNSVHKVLNHIKAYCYFLFFISRKRITFLCVGCCTVYV